MILEHCTLSKSFKLESFILTLVLCKYFLNRANFKEKVRLSIPMVNVLKGSWQDGAFSDKFHTCLLLDLKSIRCKKWRGFIYLLWQGGNNSGGFKVEASCLKWTSVEVLGLCSVWKTDVGSTEKKDVDLTWDYRQATI